MYFRSKILKNEHHYWILLIRIRPSTNFQLKLTIVIWTKFAKKGSYFQCKTDNIDMTIEFCIFELVFNQISLWTNNVEFLDQICLTKIWSKTEKVSIIIEFHLFKFVFVPNFSLNWQFWFFLIRFTQKGFFWSKIEKVNTTYFLHNSAYSN